MGRSEGGACLADPGRRVDSSSSLIEIGAEWLDFLSGQADDVAVMPARAPDSLELLLDLLYLAL